MADDVSLKAVQYSLINHDSPQLKFDDVVESLIYVVGRNQKDAVQIAYQVHEKGQASAGEFSKEIARQIASELAQVAKDRNMDLNCSIDLAN
jgi:ATP-dependent Clp protease adapter protein ClpS